MMSPERYRFFERKSRALLSQIDAYIAYVPLNKPTNPIIFKEEVHSLIDKISETIGACEIISNNPKTEQIKIKYQMLLQELIACRKKLHLERGSVLICEIHDK